MKPEESITKLTTLSFSKAQILRSRLESEGISCFLSNINLLQSDIGSGVKVFVRESDLHNAVMLMQVMKIESGDDQHEELEDLKQIRRLLVPVDYSYCSEKAVLYALELAEQLKAEIHLLHAYYNPEAHAVPVNEIFSYQVNLDEYMHKINETAKKEMANLSTFLINEAKKKDYRNISIKESLINGFPDDVILDTAEEYKPGVIIMGTKGKGSSFLPFMGSVTARVVEKSSFPVLVIPENTEIECITIKNRVLYATDFEPSDLSALHKLMSLMSPFRIELFCVHVGSGDTKIPDEEKMKILSQDVSGVFDELKIKCEVIRDDDIIEGLERYTLNNDIGIIAISTHRRHLLRRLLNQSLTIKFLYHTRVPMLVFHS